MSEKFFSQQTCDRCGGSLKSGRIMSAFSTECICMKCSEAERKHPDFRKVVAAECEEAVAADHAAIRNGDYNFPGIGWPGRKGGTK